jgi:hypothetical protein
LSDLRKPALLSSASVPKHILDLVALKHEVNVQVRSLRFYLYLCQRKVGMALDMAF